MFTSLVLSIVILSPTPLNARALELTHAVAVQEPIDIQAEKQNSFWKGNGPLYLTIIGYIAAQIADTETTLYHVNLPQCVAIGKTPCELNPIVRPFVTSRWKLMAFKTSFSIPAIYAMTQAYKKGKVYTVILGSIAAVVTSGVAMRNYCIDHPCGVK